MSYADLALCFKTLGDETRAKIVDMLKCGTLCACKILEEFSITQPTLSYHMKALVESGLVTCEKQGTWNHYSLNEELLKELMSFLDKSNKICDCNCNCE